MTPGLLIAAPASGSGKTTVTLGLLTAFRAQGLSVQPFKCGPDYIDPAFHTAASGRASFNLDSWAMPRGRIAALVAQAAGADLVIAEGAMGLFDGVAQPGETGSGASADIAALLSWPVVLVIDASGQAQSAGAVALGFARFRPDVQVAGVILNRTASPRHAAMARAGVETTGLRVFGALPRNTGIALPERHLGLVQAGEMAGLDAFLKAAGDFVATHLDLAALRSAAKTGMLPAVDHLRATPPGQRIALAQDAAFSFIYPHLLADWRAQGAEILPFSPLADQGPDSSADCCWLPGGYPELHGGTLAAATNFKSRIKTFAAARPVHGECGGYMAMGTALIDKDGARHEMAGLLGLVTSFATRRLHLGYRSATLAAPIPGLATGTRLRGHEFHYSTVLDQPDEPLAQVTDAGDAPVAETGSRRGLATGSYFHLIGPAA
ncbi:MAG: cobyrinate a,c-diamide synthase [Paracoccaceae bacterium]